MESSAVTKKHESVNRLTTSNKSIWERMFEQRFLYVMIIPGIIVLLVFSYLPMFGLVLSFTNYSLSNPLSPGEWAGFDNFKELFENTDFLLSLKNTLGISFFKIGIGFIVTVTFALLISELVFVKFKKIVQTISYLPYFVSWIIVAGLMIDWLSDTGLITQLLLNLHIIDSPVYFLGNSKYFWSVAVLSDIWKNTGYGSIIYIAAISGIDVQLYEAAVMDGAGRLAKIRHITLPGIFPTTVVLLILSLGGIMNANFDQIFALSNPLNIESSQILDILSYRTGLSMGRISYATSIGLFRSVVSLTFLLAANWLARKTTKESLF